MTYEELTDTLVSFGFGKLLNDKMTGLPKFIGHQLNIDVQEDNEFHLYPRTPGTARALAPIFTDNPDVIIKA